MFSNDVFHWLDGSVVDLVDLMWDDGDPDHGPQTALLTKICTGLADWFPTYPEHVLCEMTLH